MNKVIRYSVSAVVILTLLLGSMAMAPAARSTATVHLKGGSFVPAQGVSAQGSQKYFIVQFSGPVHEAWKEALIAQGTN